MKKLIIGFVIGVLLTIPIMLTINTPAAAPEPTPQVIYVEPTPMPTPTPEIIYQERLTDLEQVVADTKDSCVMIYAYYSDGSGEQGSGWAYGDYIVTAKHVIEGTKKIEIFTDNSNTPARGTVEYIDDNLDVAILSVPTRTLPSVTLGDSDTLIEGEKLVSITSPQGAQNVVEECTFAGKLITETQDQLTISDTLIQGGSSGGALFNYNSEVIGMVNAGNDGYAGAIPINQIKSILEK